MRIPADASIDGARGVPRSRAGLGSGPKLGLPAGGLPKRGICVKVPGVERFAEAACFWPIGDNGISEWHYTYPGIRVNQVCAFRSCVQPLNRQFCTTGQNVGTNESETKTISVSSKRAASQSRNRA